MILWGLWFFNTICLCIQIYEKKWKNTQILWKKHFLFLLLLPGVDKNFFFLFDIGSDRNWGSLSFHFKSFHSYEIFIFSVPSENKRDRRTVEQVLADSRAKKKLKTDHLTSSEVPLQDVPVDSTTSSCSDLSWWLMF